MSVVEAGPSVSSWDVKRVVLGVEKQLESAEICEQSVDEIVVESSIEQFQAHQALEVENKLETGARVLLVEVQL